MLYHHPEEGLKSESVLSDQLTDQNYAHVHNLPRIFSEERVKTVLDTVWRLNVESTPYGVRVAVGPDGSMETSEGLYGTSLMPSWPSIAPAMLLIYSGDRERGEELMRRTWRHLVMDLQRPWDMPCGLGTEGEHRWGLEYYHNTMLWMLPIAVLGQHLKSYCAPGGFVDRIVKAARS